MTRKPTKSSSERKTRKLRLKKETLKDLGAKNAKGVKGGTLIFSAGCRLRPPTTAQCGGGGTLDVTLLCRTP